MIRPRSSRRDNAIAIGWLIFVAILFGIAWGTWLHNPTPPPTYAYGGNDCAADDPGPPYNRICTGNGTSCLVMLDGCSATPGEPGTWNPRGYTPKTDGS